jgi:hypothetical protein
MIAFFKVPGRWLEGLLVSCLLVAAFSAPASSRRWKPDAKAAAQDYAQIIDSKANGAIVMVWWLVPQLVPTLPQAQQVLDNYVIVGVGEGHVAPTGTMSFAAIDPLGANDGSGRALKFLRTNDIPPTITGLLAGLQAALSRSLGALGQGIHWFVFEAQASLPGDRAACPFPLKAKPISMKRRSPAAQKSDRL